MFEERRELAWKAHRDGDLRQAESIYRELLQTDRNPEDAVNLGALLRSQGRLKEASVLYRHWLEAFPDALQLHLNAANCLHDLNEHEACVAIMGGYLQRHPEERRVQRAMARSLTELGRHSEAEQLLRQLSQGEPEAVAVWLDLGLCLHRQGKMADALACFEQVCALEPENTIAASNRIVMLKDAGRFQACREAIAAMPEEVQKAPLVRSAIAGLYMQEMDMEAAAKELASLCNAAPEQGDNWLNLAASLRHLKHCNAALRVLKRGLCWHPHDTSLKQSLGQCLAELGKTSEALPVLFDSAGPMEQIRSDHLFNLQFLGSAYHLIAPDELRQWALAWERRVQRESGVGPLWPDAVREPAAGRRLRIGYLSADWCNHPVGRFMRPVLAAHDRNTVEVWGLCSSPHRDAMRDHLQQLCEHWLDLRHASELEAARAMADLQLDVVVELGGYTGHSRLEALIHRAAPVQLSYLGYFGPTYLHAIDGWIGDPELFGGLGEVDRQAQRLWQVEGGYMAYAPHVQLPEPDRCAARAFRFGSFNHSRKLNPGSIALYARVLKAVPESELVLKSISFVEPAERERLEAALVAAGIAEERLILLDTVASTEEHLALYREVDAVLDPFPYGGATTTGDALVMGVPVVSLAGRGMVGRLSSSMLASAGLGAWIARSEAEYQRIATELAGAGPRQASQRRALREQVLRSPLCDGQRVARALEQIYQQAYRAAMPA